MRYVRYTLVFLLLIAPTLWADNTGEQSPASSAQESSPTTSWTNIDSVFASDNQRSVYTGTSGDTIYVTNFTMGVTADATIDSIFVTTEGHGTATQAARRRLKVQLVKDGKTVVGESGNFTHALDTDDTQRQTGGTTPLWNTTWTAAEVNSTNFGIAALKTASQAGTIRLDHVTIYIAFTEADGEVQTRRRRMLISE